MSGGAWNYQQYKIYDDAQAITPLLEAVAITEHEADWAESGDTSKDDAAKRIYELWVHVFDTLYGEGDPKCLQWLNYHGCPVAKEEMHNP